jgi:hypothetical protein
MRIRDPALLVIFLFDKSSGVGLEIRWSFLRYPSLLHREKSEGNSEDSGDMVRKPGNG